MENDKRKEIEGTIRSLETSLGALKQSLFIPPQKEINNKKVIYGADHDQDTKNAIEKLFRNTINGKLDSIKRVLENFYLDNSVFDSAPPKGDLFSLACIHGHLDVAKFYYENFPIARINILKTPEHDFWDDLFEHTPYTQRFIPLIEWFHENLNPAHYGDVYDDIFLFACCNQDIDALNFIIRVTKGTKILSNLIPRVVKIAIAERKFNMILYFQAAFPDFFQNEEIKKDVSDAILISSRQR